MRKIAVVKVTWFNEYCHEGYISCSHPVLSGMGDWQEVTEEEYNEIDCFIRSQKTGYYQNEPKHVIIERDQGIFETDFSAWKERQKKEKEKRLKAQESRMKVDLKKEKQKKDKALEKARKILKEAGELK